MAKTTKVTNEEAFDACIELAKTSGFLALGPVKINNMRLLGCLAAFGVLLTVIMAGLDKLYVNLAISTQILSFIWAAQPTFESFVRNTFRSLADDSANAKTRKRSKTVKLENYHEN